MMLRSTQSPPDIGHHASSKKSTMPRLLKGAAATIAISVAATFSGVAFGVNHSTLGSNIAGCIDGNCQPRTQSYGYYPASWRKWPGYRPYEGWRKPQVPISIPDDQIPEGREETRFENRTRSDRPLDGPSLDADPNNPFQPVPESDLPGNNSQPSSGGLDTDLGSDFGADLGTDLGLPTSNDDALAAPDTDLPLPGENGPSGEDTRTEEDSIFNFDSEPSSTETPPSDNGLFDSLPDEGDNEAEDPLFDFGSQIPSSTSPKNAANVGPVRLIRSRPLKQATASSTNSASGTRDQVLQQLAASSLIQPVESQGLQLPKYGTVGNLNGEFGATDLMSPPKRQAGASSQRSGRRRVGSNIEQVTHEESQHDKLESSMSGSAVRNHPSAEVLMEVTDNPLRPRRRVISNAEKSSIKQPVKGQLVPEANIDLRPIPGHTSHQGFEERNDDAIPHSEAVVEQASVPSRSTKTSIASISPKRTHLASLEERSLRETLRKNPLRR